jgi:hypothetical protein
MKRTCTCGFAIGHPLVPKCTCEISKPLTKNQIAILFNMHTEDLNFPRLVADVRVVEAAHGIK